MTVQLVEDALPVCSLGQLCEDPPCSFHLAGGKKTHFVEKGREIPCNPGNYVPFVVPGLSTASSSSCAESTASTP